LADGIAALATAYAVLVALRARDSIGQGQVIDLAIIEPILTILGAQPTVYDQIGVIQQRTGNRSSNNAPRNTYRAADGTWLAVSTSAQSVAERLLRLVGRPDLIEEPWFASGIGRAEHADILDQAVGAWIAARQSAEVIAAFEAAEAAVAPVHDVAGVVADPQYQALESLIRVPDPDLGSVLMQNMLFRLSLTPGSIESTGPRLGEHNDEVFSGLGLDAAQRAALAREGVL
jgi:formyl-CoA transferase